MSEKLKMGWLNIFFLCLLSGHVYGSPVVKNPELLTQSSSEIMITLRESVVPILRDLAQRSYPNRGAKLTAITNTLKAATALSQAPIIAALKPFKVEYQSFWVTNKIFIKNANPVLVKLLETFDQVMEIRKPKLPSFPPLNPIEGVPPNVREHSYNSIHSFLLVIFHKFFILIFLF